MADSDDRWRQLATALISGMLGVSITMFGMLLSEAKEIKTRLEALAIEQARQNGEMKGLYDRMAVQDAAKIRGEKR